MRTISLTAILLAFPIAPAWAQQPGKAPLPEAVFGPGAAAEWSAQAADFELAKTTVRGKPVLAVQKGGLILDGTNPLSGPRQLRAWVRLRTDQVPGVSAAFVLGRKDAKDPGLRLTLTASRGAPHVSAHVQQGGKPLHDAAALSKDLDWTAEPSNGLTYYVRAYPLTDIRPGWPEDFRLRVEHDMAALPDVPQKWLAVRIELRDGEVRCWLDDRLVAHKRGKDVLGTGLARLEFSPGVELAGFEVQPWQPTPRFVPIGLDGCANGRAFLGGASVQAGSLSDKLTMIDGVLFLFPEINPEGNDHLDIGKSLYRQANVEGYWPSYEQRWAGAARRDPRRIQLRVPNGQYDRLYLVAAADDGPDRVPLVTAMFYRPSAGFAERFAARVPLATAPATEAKPLPVVLTNGQKVNLWLVTIPLDPGRLSAFADLDIVEIELTKEVRQFRSYPDPFIYGWHQAGPPSSVHVYGVTLGEVPVGFTWTPDKFGHVWSAPATPGYTAGLLNHTGGPVEGKLTVATRSHDGTETTRQEKVVSLGKGQAAQLKVPVAVKQHGYHDITATLEIAGRKWTEERSLVLLAPDTRASTWTEGKGALFGYWSYHGGHHTPKKEHHVELMTLAGARTSIGWVDHPLSRKHWARVPAGAWEVSPQPWALEEPIDPQKYAKYQQEVVAAYKKARESVPAEHRPDHVYFFPEPHVSQRLTDGNYPTYWNAPEYHLTAEEKQRIRMYLVTAKCAAEAIRKEWPDLKILVPWGDPLFVVPLLRAGFPKHLIDGSGLDMPGFERLPEMQLHQIALHRLYELRKEFAKAGIARPMLQYCEGIFVPTEPGAVTPREQMDLYNRWALLSMAHGVERFYSGWFAFDCGNYYGSEHYGGCGIQRRIPYCDPKPAYAAYATMTDRLDQANFDGWLPTGSLTSYCQRFKGPRGPVYALWTVRGKRPVTLILAKDAPVHVTDAMNNTRIVLSKEQRVTIATNPSVVYITGAEIVSAAAGEPDHSDAAPAKTAQVIADLGDGSWTYSDRRDKVYENGTYAVQRFLGKFSAKVVDDPARGKVLESTLEKQETTHELMPWYNILVPAKPIVLAGAPSALGLWVKGASDWGRVIYVLRDAKGEKWTSIGTQDEYNCDDVHSWSAFNFDGWRYVRFELPGHTGYDNFRKHGTTWWRSDGGDGVVDLPLTLEAILVEQRTHILYVNDVQPVASSAAQFGKLHVEYDTPDDATPEAVRLSRLRQPLPEGEADLPNPIARMQKEGKAEPTAITKLAPPLEYNDGTPVHVYYKEVSGAKAHHVWVSAHADGRGAVNLTPQGAKSGVRVAGLRPGVAFYFWVTYVDGQGQPSRPSAPVTATLVDTFQQR
jgi:hypothetical protein